MSSSSFQSSTPNGPNRSSYYPVTPTAGQTGTPSDTASSAAASAARQAASSIPASWGQGFPNSSPRLGSHGLDSFQRSNGFGGYPVNYPLNANSTILPATAQATSSTQTSSDNNNSMLNQMQMMLMMVLASRNNNSNQRSAISQTGATEHNIDGRGLSNVDVGQGGSNTVNDAIIKGGNNTVQQSGTGNRNTVEIIEGGTRGTNSISQNGDNNSHSIMSGSSQEVITVGGNGNQIFNQTGGGDDIINVGGSKNQTKLDTGTGNDTIVLAGLDGNNQVNGGAGNDNIVIAGNGTTTVADNSQHTAKQVEIDSVNGEIAELTKQRDEQKSIADSAGSSHKKRRKRANKAADELDSKIKEKQQALEAKQKELAALGPVATSGVQTSEIDGGDGNDVITVGGQNQNVIVNAGAGDALNLVGAEGEWEKTAQNGATIYTNKGKNITLRVNGAAAINYGAAEPAPTATSAAGTPAVTANAAASQAQSAASTPVDLAARAVMGTNAANGLLPQYAFNQGVARSSAPTGSSLNWNAFATNAFINQAYGADYYTVNRRDDAKSGNAASV